MTRRILGLVETSRRRAQRRITPKITRITTTTRTIHNQLGIGAHPSHESILDGSSSARDHETSAASRTVQIWCQDLGRRPASAGLELLVLRDAHTGAPSVPVASSLEHGAGPGSRGHSSDCGFPIATLALGHRPTQVEGARSGALLDHQISCK